MTLTNTAYIDLLNNMVDTLLLVANEESTRLHPYVESKLFQTIAACEDACIVDGEFNWENAQPDPLKPVVSAAWDLIGMLAAEGSDNALKEQTRLIDALETYEYKTACSASSTSQEGA